MEAAVLLEAEIVFDATAGTGRSCLRSEGGMSGSYCRTLRSCSMIGMKVMVKDAWCSQMKGDGRRRGWVICRAGGAM